jgi:hypothetical protein
MKLIRNVGKWIKSLLTNKKTKATTTSKYYPPAPVNENFRRFRIGRQKKVSRYLNPTGGKGWYRKAPSIQ